MSGGGPSRRSPPTTYHDEPYGQQQDYYSEPYRDSPTRGYQQHPQLPPAAAYPTSSPGPRFHPGAHPDSSYNQMNSQRDYEAFSPVQGSSRGNDHPPPPPVHQQPLAGQGHQRDVPSAQIYGDISPVDRNGPYASPNSNRMGDRAVGGGYGASGYDSPGRSPMGRNMPSESDPLYADQRSIESRGNLHQQPSYASGLPLAGAAYGPGMMHPAASYSDVSLGRNGGFPPPSQFAGDHYDPYVYSNTPYNRYSSSNQLANLGPIDPMDIADDDHDIIPPAQNKRRSFMNIGRNSQTSSREGIPLAAAGVAGAAGAAGGAGGAGGTASLSGGSATGSSPLANGNYASVANGAANHGVGMDEKDDEWLAGETRSKKRLRLILGVIAVVLIVGAIVGGTLAGVLLKNRRANDSSRGPSAAEDTAANGDLDKNSAEIRRLMNNPNLKRVFPGMDYTPLNSQYPECLTHPPSQNNVTRDVAVLSQMTKKLRLYGTDCNQTQMVLHAMDRLDLKGDLKMWLGVWLGNNKTTNDRQLSQLWSILDTYGQDPFVGVVVGNEVLFRKDMTNVELAKVLADVKTNLTTRGMTLPLGTSDLGDNWTAELASEVDVIMANIHPFFAGATSTEAAGWTWKFWQDHDVAVTKGMTSKRHVISEVGWPSTGGNHCGQRECTSKADGSVAGINQLNEFMEQWVCTSFKNGTDYYWFEAFDEPWKIVYNEPDKGKEWEDKWGLMDVNRNLKPGVKIPDCGGQRV